MHLSHIKKSKDVYQITKDLIHYYLLILFITGMHCNVDNRMQIDSQTIKYNLSVNYI